MFFWKKTVFFWNVGTVSKNAELAAPEGVSAIKGKEHHEVSADPRDLFREQNEFNTYQK